MLKLLSVIYKRYKKPVSQGILKSSSVAVSIIKNTVKIGGKVSSNLKKEILEIKDEYLKEIEKWQSEVKNKKIIEEFKGKPLELIDKKISTTPQNKYLKAYRRDYEDLILLLKKYDIKKVYHFTDKKNWELIKNSGGLFSLQKIREKNLSPVFGGNEDSQQLDCFYGWDNYVHLSFCEEHPMGHVCKKKGRIQNLLILSIDLEPLFWEDTVFTDMNAIKNGHKKIDNIKDLENKVDLSVCKGSYFNTDVKLRDMYQAEILVQNFIPLEYINLHKNG